jgi:hypothetical protein
MNVENKKNEESAVKSTKAAKLTEATKIYYAAMFVAGSLVSGLSGKVMWGVAMLAGVVAIVSGVQMVIERTIGPIMKSMKEQSVASKAPGA